MKHSKFEWSVLSICILVFGIVGTVFTILGGTFALHIDEIAASPNSRGDVRILPWVFGGMGICFLIVTVILVCVSVKSGRKRRRLLEEGYSIYAVVSEVQQNLLVRVNRRHPFYLLCTAANPRTGETMTFRSRDTMEDLSYLIGRSVRVFLDRNDYNNYYVEIHREG